MIKNLYPYVHVIKLVGGTGDGKTEFSAVFAEPAARKILLKCVGSTNSTVRERMIVYTTDSDFSGKILVAASLGEEILERKVFSDMVITAMAEVARSNGKAAVSKENKPENEFKEALLAQIKKRNNTTAVLDFLDEEERQEFVEKIRAVYMEYHFSERNYEIYNMARNSVPKREAGDDSNKFLGVLKNETVRSIDHMGGEFTKKLLGSCNDVNELLRKKFFEYFDREQRSEDGFYYKEISLNESEEDNAFIEAMFTSNDLQKGERLSLEVLCGQIFIYTPMNAAVENIIADDQTAKKVFSDEHGSYTFGILDTRGLYHTSFSDGDNGDYLKELVYYGEIDATAMVVPLQGDTNEKKINELYRGLLESFKKQTPVFIINKVDLFIDALEKDHYGYDPFSTEIAAENGLTSEDIIKSVNERVTELQSEFRESLNEAGKNLEITALPCYLRRDGGMRQKDVVEKYNIRNVVKEILHQTAVFLEKAAVKIRIRLDGEDDVAVSINDKELLDCVESRIQEAETDKKVFTPGAKNIAENIGICPHGNSYNALRRQLKYGNGYSCNIDEGYFINCQSFTINFTGNLNNFASQEFIRKVLARAVGIENGDIDPKDGEKFWTLVQKNVNTRKFVSILLYDHALHDAEMAGFGPATYFNGFLKNSMPFFCQGRIDEDMYTEALKQVIKEAVEKTIAMNVIYI